MKNFIAPSQENEKTKKRITVVVSICLAISLVIFIVDLSMPLGVSISMVYTILVLISLWLPSIKSSMLIALVASLLLFTGAILSPPGGELWKGVFNRCLTLFVIWSAAALMIQKKIMERKRKKAELAREEALSRIKVLHGLLPICANCKKIHDDQGYWSQIEEYIKENSEADFTHSICPECIKKLYPDYTAG